MSFNVYREERRTWFAREGSPSRRWGWYVSWHEGRSVACFETRADQNQFVAAVKQVCGVGENWQAEEIAAAVALRTWGDSDEDCDFGYPCVDKALACIPDHQREDVGEFLDGLVLEWECGHGRSKANAEHLKATLERMREEGLSVGMEALAAPGAAPQTMER